MTREKPGQQGRKVRGVVLFHYPNRATVAKSQHQLPELLRSPQPVLDVKTAAN